ncbi:MAG: hypothetical protein Q8M99_05385 [Methylotenera sp.]|nr:hypothetical protein [Methylotenera sp.]
MDQFISKHAKIRAQQRGIPACMNEILDLYGNEQHDGHGGVIFYLDKTSIQDIEQDMGRQSARRLDNSLNAYKVINSMHGVTVTTGHRHARIWR